MRIHGVLVVRDEIDLIDQVLDHLVSWLDAVYVYDSGSIDGTWEAIRAAAGRDGRIVPLARETVYWWGGLPGYAFELCRKHMRDGDWFARLDADEFFQDDARAFLRDGIRPSDGRVYIRQADFMLTRTDARAWEEGRETVADRARPIEERRTRYVVQAYPEVRLFRYRRRMRWPADSYVPLCGGRIARDRLLVRHYRWRDPMQAAARCLLRSAMRQSGELVGAVHWDLEDWTKWITDDQAPHLERWEPGTPLRMPPDDRPHLPRGQRGLVQDALYVTGLCRAADLVLPGWARGRRPKAIPAEIQARLAEEYRRLGIAVSEYPED